MRSPRKPRRIEVFHDGQPIYRGAVKQLAQQDAAKEGFVSASEAVAKTGVSPHSLQTWHQRGLISGKKIGRSWYYSRVDLIRALRTEGMKGHRS